MSKYTIISYENSLIMSSNFLSSFPKKESMIINEELKEYILNILNIKDVLIKSSIEMHFNSLIEFNVEFEYVLVNKTYYLCLLRPQYIEDIYKSNVLKSYINPKPLIIDKTKLKELNKSLGKIFDISKLDIRTKLLLITLIECSRIIF